MEKAEVKVYLKKPLKDSLAEESKKSGDSMSFIMSQALERELKRRSK